MSDTNDDYQVQNYQDDVTTDDNVRDKISDELTDDPTKELGVNPNEFKAELDSYAGDSTDDDDDDRREEIEDLDEDEDARDDQ